MNIDHILNLETQSNSIMKIMIYIFQHLSPTKILVYTLYINHFTQCKRAENGNFVTKQFRTGDEACDFIEATEEFYVGRR